MTTGGLPPGIFHPFSPRGRVDPYPAYRWLQEHAPLYLDNFSRLWLVTSYPGCSVVLRDQRFSAALAQRRRVRDEALPSSMLTTDPPEHGRLRGPGTLLLGPAALHSQTPLIEAEIGKLLAGLGTRTGEDADAIADIGEPLAVAVLSSLLRIDPADRTAFAGLARRASVNLDPLAGAEAGAAGRRAVGELTSWLDPHVTAVSRAEPDSPLARLAADPRLTRQEMLGILSLVVVGGYAPLTEFTGNALGRLLSRPDARPGEPVLAGLGLTDPGRAETAVDELLRLDGPIPFIARVATCDIELAGGRVPAGAQVLAVLAAANRDPDVFADPDRADLSRAPNPHLAMGAGPHFCLAAPLIRRAGAIALRGLAGRFPRARAIDPVQRWAPALLPRKLTAFGIRLN
ncbi:MAG: cytochrome P450 [Streptosporangiaceae bacterium]|nr:cytochrome P450 [Streptosporangiaceae bacterium]